MFFQKVEKCRTCWRDMDEVPVEQVPGEARREFARMARWQQMTTKGWYWCRFCKFYIHVPTADAQRPK